MGQWRLLAFALIAGALLTFLSGINSSILLPESPLAKSMKYSAMIQAGFIIVREYGFPMPWLMKVVAVLGPIPPTAYLRLIQPNFLIVGLFIDFAIWFIVGIPIILARVYAKARRQLETSTSRL
jgi:hypothetical protein